MVDLTQIQKLQFTDLPAAEAELLSHLHDCGYSEVQSIKVLPKPQSLNSISGLVTLKNGEELFFKTHTEENEQLAEYYNSQLLESVGYPVIRAEAAQTNPGAQLALYKKIELPTLFDLVHEHEHSSKESWVALLSAQERLDKKTFKIFEKTACSISEEENQKQPIHQLFAHRLAENGRVTSFYRDTLIADKPTSELFSKKWRVNGTLLSRSIAESIETAREVLKPSTRTNAVVGHGDAHNGNIFYDGDMHYFDPAFCGTHSPSLDLVKPLFHNLFARWMYLPGKVDSEFELSIDASKEVIEVEHNYTPSKLREEFLQSKVLNLLRPLGRKLDEKTLRYGMFCCPFLTINLARTEPGRLESAYSNKIRFLGLVFSVLCSSEKQPNDTVGRMLEHIFSCE